MSEKSAVHTVHNHISRLPGVVHWQRFEDALQSGIPDSNIAWSGWPQDFWVEYKHLDPAKLPKRSNTPVRIGLKPEQAVWLTMRQLVPHAECRVCLRLERSWLVFDRGWSELRDGLPWAALVILAATTWEGTFDAKKLLFPRGVPSNVSFAL